MQDPAQVVFGRLAVALESDDAFQIFVVVRKEHVACLIANQLDLFQAKLRGVTLSRHALEIVEHVPVRLFAVFISQLVPADNHLHEEPLCFTDVQHESANRMSAEERGPADHVVGKVFHRDVKLVAHLFHATEIVANAGRQPWMRSQHSASHTTTGPFSGCGLTTISSRSAAVAPTTALTRNATVGPFQSKIIPISNEAENTVTPNARLYKPYAVPRCSGRTRSATNAFSAPSDKPKYMP